MIEKVKAKCNKDVVYFPNWVDLEVFYPIREKEELKRNFGFNATDTIFLYSGAIGKKQGLEAILHSAKKLSHLPNLKFAICGSGPYKEALKRQKEKMNLSNVVFLPLQPFKTFNSFLNIADVHLVLQKAEASDLVLPSKLSTILSVGGVAIVTANQGTSLYDIMSSSNMGIVIRPENQSDLDFAIENFVHYESNIMAENARSYAEKHLSANRILSRYFNQILSTKKPYANSTFKRYLMPQTSRVRLGP
jgi:colanic acid biosynthesis glycosyl transferase WcaI